MAWSRTSRHERGYGTAWERLRKRILARDHYLCQPCKRAKRIKAGSQVDHIVPKAKGGSDDEANLECICRDCHVAKTIRENGGTPKVKHVTGLDGWSV